MWIVKTIGFILIVITGISAGLNSSGKLKKRTRALEWYFLAINSIADKIGGTGAELYDIINTICGSADYLVLKKPFEVVLKNTYLNSADRQAAEEFFAELGMGDSESQIKRCKIYANIFEQRLKAAKKEYEEKSKLYKMLGLFSGLSVAIVIM